jgi:hypothetical protein
MKMLLAVLTAVAGCAPQVDSTHARPRHRQHWLVAIRTADQHVRSGQIFMDRWGASRTPRRLGRPASRPALSPSESIPGPSGRVPRRTRATVREEREPSSGPPPASLGSLALPRRSVPRRRFGDLDPIPFRPRARPPSPPRGEAGVHRTPSLRKEPRDRARWPEDFLPDHVCSFLVRVS